MLRELRRKNVTFCSISYPDLPDQVLKTNQLVYYRFHGVPKLYLSSYSDYFLNRVAGDIHQLPNVTDVYAYFNNDIEVAAVYNARSLHSIAVSLETRPA